jgi:hypothetical protein
VRVLVRSGQRRGTASEDRDLGAADFGGQQRVARRLGERDIVGDDGQPQTLTSGAASAMMIASASSKCCVCR